METSLKQYPQSEKPLKILAWVVSGLVIILVGLMRQVKIPVPETLDLSFLPAFNALVNSLTAVALLASLYFIRRKQVIAHRNANFTALTLSAIFLLSYVAYHFTTDSVIYGDVNANGVLEAAEATAVASTRTAYLVLLLSHISLAGIILPFILFTFIRAHVGKYQQHKAMARYVWPLWFYVALTGPIVYWMLRPYYS